MMDARTIESSDSQEDRAAMIGWDRGFPAVDYGDLGDRARAGESVRMPGATGPDPKLPPGAVRGGARRDARTSARKDRRGRIVAGAGVAAVELTEASKLTTAPFGARPVSATYVSQGSCPAGCRWGSWNGGGCYVEQGPTGRVTRRLADEYGIAPGVEWIEQPGGSAASHVRASDSMALELARREADAIDALSGAGGRPLRLHVVGDCRTDAAAWIVASAANRYRARGGGLVWTYTHAWREVARWHWAGESVTGPGGTWGGYGVDDAARAARGAPVIGCGAVSVLASCETDADVAEARARGYAVALVRDFDAIPTATARDDRANRVYHHADGTLRARVAGDPYMGDDGGAHAHRYVGDVGTRAVLCPQQTGQLPDCASCMACARDTRLIRSGSVIVLAPHGPGGKPTKAMRAKLDRIQAEGAGGELGAF